MPKQLVVDQIEVTKNGTIQIRMHKLSSDGDLIGNHRTAVEPGGDVDAQMANVNSDLGSQGYAPITAEDMAKIKLQATAAWTPANIAPVTAEVVAATQAQRDAEVQHAQAIKDAQERESAANIAKTKAEAAEALAKEATDKANAATQAMNDALAAQAAAEKAVADKKTFDAAVAQKAAELTQLQGA